MHVQPDPADPQSQPQSFSAAFELQGDAQQGSLNFYTPLGSTAAVIRWTPESAQLTARGETHQFSGLAPLTAHMLGTEVPVSAFFSWLKGKSLSAAGWNVDLTQFNQGKITAQRLTPAPEAQLRVILDN